MSILLNQTTPMGYTLVTGATSDIGHQICLTLEANGHHLFMIDLFSDALEEMQKNMTQPSNHLSLSLDFSDVENSKNMLSKFLIENQITISNAVFAAGIFAIKPMRTVDYAFLKKNFDIAIFSLYEIVKVLISKKINSSQLEAIVMISSVSAVMGTKGYTVYSAVKSAMLGLMKSMACELAPKVRVNAVLPGGIKTKTTNFIYESQEEISPRYLLGEGKALDIANIIEFLLSSKARWITGQQIIIDGGLSCN